MVDTVTVTFRTFYIEAGPWYPRMIFIIVYTSHQLYSWYLMETHQMLGHFQTVEKNAPASNSHNQFNQPNSFHFSV